MAENGRHAHDHHGHEGHEGNHGHAHGHGHGSLGHVHAPADFGRAVAIGTVLNVAFVVAEVSFGLLSNSMALLADAGHNLSDVFGLLMAWGAATLARKGPTPRFTYGYRSSSILAALANAVLLLLAVGAICLEAVQRLVEPAPITETTVIVVAGVGILINGATALLFVSGGREDINIRGAFLHMAADAGVSLGVVLAGILIMLTGWHRLDAIVSLAIAAVIVWSTWSLLATSMNMALDAVPAGINPGEVRSYLARLDGVDSVHDLHIWPMSTTETAMTCHLVMHKGHPGDAFLASSARELSHRFGIGHATIQVEVGDAGVCQLEPDQVV